MSERIARYFLIVIAIAEFSLGHLNQPTTSKKSGVCLNPNEVRCDDMNDEQSSPLYTDTIGWYYSWGRYSPLQSTPCDPLKPSKCKNCDPIPNKEFVPMIWGKSQTHIDNNQISFTYIDTVNTTYLLGFNEPNRKEQSNINPEDAAQYWKDYVIPLWSNTHHLVSPVPNTCYNPNCPGAQCPCIDGYADAKDWLNDFFDEFDGSTRAERIENSSIDYIAAHAYTCNIEDVMDTLDDLYQTYGKQVWLTEFACNSAGTKSEQEVIEYLEGDGVDEGIIEELEDATYVFRYSFYRSRSIITSDYRSVLNNTDWETTDPAFSDVGEVYIDAIELHD